MRGLFLTSYAVLWALVLLTILLVILLYRQFGMIAMPPRRRMAMEGVDLGAEAPALPMTFINRDRPSVLDWRPFHGEPAPDYWLVLFAEPSCPICQGLITGKHLDSLASEWPDVEFVWLDGKPLDDDLWPRDWVVAFSSDDTALRAMEIPAFPFGYVVDSRGRVQAKGLVSSVSELTSLLFEARHAARSKRDAQPVIEESASE